MNRAVLLPLVSTLFFLPLSVPAALLRASSSPRRSLTSEQRRLTDADELQSVLDEAQTKWTSTNYDVTVQMITSHCLGTTSQCGVVGSITPVDISVRHDRIVSTDGQFDTLTIKDIFKAIQVSIDELSNGETAYTVTAEATYHKDLGYPQYVSIRRTMTAKDVAFDELRESKMTISVANMKIRAPEFMDILDPPISPKNRQDITEKVLAAREQWEIVDYSYGFHQVAPITVKSSLLQVVSVHRQEPGGSPEVVNVTVGTNPKTRYTQRPGKANAGTIDAFFDILQTTLENNSTTVDVYFDALYNYPVFFNVSRDGLDGKTNSDGSISYLSMAIDFMTPWDLLRQELQEAEVKWQSSAMVDYDLTKRCLCDGANADSVVIAIRNGTIENIGSGRTSYETIPQFFQRIREAMNNRSVRMSVRYDERLGYPTFVRLPKPDGDPMALTLRDYDEYAINIGNAMATNDTNKGNNHTTDFDENDKGSGNVFDKDTGSPSLTPTLAPMQLTPAPVTTPTSTPMPIAFPAPTSASTPMSTPTPTPTSAPMSTPMPASTPSWMKDSKHAAMVKQLQIEKRQAQHLWKSWDVDTYSVRIRVGGDQDATTYLVEGDQENVKVMSGTIHSNESLGTFQKVSEMFDFIDASLNSGASVVQVEYHELYGYPMKVTVSLDGELETIEIPAGSSRKHRGLLAYSRMAISVDADGNKQDDGPDGQGGSDTKFFKLSVESLVPYSVFQQNLDEASNMWHMTSYDASFRSRATGALSKRMRVRDSVIVDVEDLESGEPTSKNDVSTVEDVFGTIQKAIDDRAIDLNTVFDPILGYPTLVEWVDGELNEKTGLSLWDVVSNSTIEETLDPMPNSNSSISVSSLDGDDPSPAEDPSRAEDPADSAAGFRLVIPAGLCLFTWIMIIMM